MISSVFVVLSLRIVGMALWLILTLLLARSLSVTEFALATLSINIILLLGALATLGAEVPVLRFGSSSWREDKHDQFKGELRQSKWLAFAGATCAVLVMTVCVELNVLQLEALPPWGFMAVCVGILISGQIVVQRTALQSAGRVGEGIFTESFLRSFITLFLVGLAAFLGQLSFNTVLISYITALFIGWTLQLYSLSRLCPAKVMHVSIRSRLKFALSAWPGDAALVAFQRLPGVLVGFATDLETAAVFLAAERMAQAGMFLIDAVRAVIAPMIAAAEKNERQGAISMGSAIMLLAGLAGVVCTLAFSSFFVHYLGDAYAGAMPLISILLVGQISFSIFGPASIILNMYGQAKIRSIVAIFATMIFCIGLTFLASNIYYVSILYVCMIWFMNGLLALCIWKRLGQSTGIFSVTPDLVLDIFKNFPGTIKANSTKKTNPKRK